MLLGRFSGFFFSACAIFILCSPAYCQVVSTNGNIGLPYSAHMVTTLVQALADGTQITHVSRRFEARDSQGRRRIEYFYPENENRDANARGPLSVVIFDPVAGQLIRLHPQQKTAEVLAFPTPSGHSDAQTNTPSLHTELQGSASQSRNAATRSMPLVKIEQLPGEMMNGIYAEGRRVTRTIPAGKEGNNRDITTVNETWFSPDLNIDVLVKTTDPRFGNRTTELKDLSRDEPAPELFQVPAEYTITSRQN